MDAVLRRFVDEADEAGAERELATLIEQRALPLARAIVGRKLRAYRDDKPGRSAVEDREDVVANAMMTLVERLRAARFEADAMPIDNFDHYAAAVVHSACAHHIRRRYPERARLKNRLRYVFATDRRLALWAYDEDVVCGLAGWRSRPADPAAERAVAARADAHRRPWAELTKRDLADAVVDLVAGIEGPIEFEALVGAAASAARVAEPRDAGDVSALASCEPALDVVLDQRRFLARVWDEVRELPVRQRLALLLNLRDTTGAGLLWLLPVAGIATLRQIARVLEMPDSDFARLWRDIPLDDRAIGRRLGCDRQQVINLRMAARKRLMNRVAGPPARSRQPEGNLAPVSASVKGSA
jgi:hypothetical protein